jgi:hypothetical protein
MSSPYPPGTQRGTEETLQAISKTIEWASRIDTRNDADISLGTTLDELKQEENRLRNQYRVETTEIAIDNFVANNPELVENILFGGLDERVDALDQLAKYISNDFGAEKPLSLKKEELMWLVAQEVQSVKTNYTLDEYMQEPFSNEDLGSKGSKPEAWEDSSFPIYNRAN